MKRLSIKVQNRILVAAEQARRMRSRTSSIESYLFCLCLFAYAYVSGTHFTSHLTSFATAALASALLSLADTVSTSGGTQINR